MQMSKEVHILKLDDILPNRFQPRIIFDESAINELTESIKQYGVIEPIIVRKVADKYEIIAGERRYKASVLAGKENIPAIITDLNDKDSAEIALIENVQRQNLTPIEEAVSYKKILDMGYMNQSELAEKLGKTQSTIANKLRLLNLTDTVQEALLQERISERHARSLLRLPSDKQNDMLDKIIKNRMTVRKTDEEINKILSGKEETEEKENEKLPEVVSIENIKNEEVSNTNTNNENILLNQNDIKEEKEENNMNNNDFMNQFNIPNTPIIEPQAQPQFTNESQIQNQQSPMMQQQVNTPQFMQTPEVQSQFVQPNPIENQVQQPIDIQNQYVAPQPVQQVPQNGPEFFNNVQQPQVQPAPVVNPVIPQPEVNQFQNPVSYDQAIAPQTINNEPASALNDDTPISGRFFNMFGESNENDLSQSVQSQEPIQAVPEQPQNFDFNPFGNMAPQQPQVQPAPVETVNNNYSEPIPMPNVPVAPEMNPEFNQVQPQVQSQPEFLNSVQPFQLNDNQEFTNSSVVELGTLGNNRMEEPTLQPLMDSNEPKITMDMKQVINLIRNCADQIEKSGYTIDTDELDFDDHYQVVFKINKID